MRTHYSEIMERNNVQKLIDLKSNRVAFEANSGKVSSDVWNHFVCIKVDENKTDYVKCAKCRQVMALAHVDRCGSNWRRLTSLVRFGEENANMGSGIRTGMEQEWDSVLRERY